MDTEKTKRARQSMFNLDERVHRAIKIQAAQSGLRLGEVVEMAMRRAFPHAWELAAEEEPQP